MWKKERKARIRYYGRGLGKVVWGCCYRDDTDKGLCMQNLSCDYDMTEEVFRQIGVVP